MAAHPPAPELPETLVADAALSAQNLVEGNSRFAGGGAPGQPGEARPVMCAPEDGFMQHTSSPATSTPKMVMAPKADSPMPVDRL